MKKMLSLIKACMTDNMSLFNIKKKNKTKKRGKGLTIVLFLIVGMSIFSYAESFLEILAPQHKEHVVLAMFAFITAILIVMEGVYKAGSLIFNCKDDDLLLSLPISKATVVFIRILKFYVFELLYGALFLVPTMIAYATRTQVTGTFYGVSVATIVLLPIIPIAISALIGIVVSATSVKFKNKSIIQILVSMCALVGVLYVSLNSEGIMTALSNNAGVFEDFIAKAYYPAFAYSKLVVAFDIKELLVFIGIHIATFVATIFIISKTYFKINSGLKKVQKSSGKKGYSVHPNKPKVAIIKKELKKAINTPVLITNAVFGLVLFVIGCVAVAVKFDALWNIPPETMPITPEQISAYVPVILVILITAASFTSSITSSMISLEGKSFIILKSLPVEPYEVIISKVYAALIMMMPFVLIGDVIFYVRFGFNIIEILLTLIASIVLPFIAEMIGILVNLRYPEMNADNDAQVVKQSSSSTVSVLFGFLLIFVVAGALSAAVFMQGNIYMCLAVYDVICLVICAGLIRRAKRKGTERFKKIDV